MLCVLRGILIVMSLPTLIISWLGATILCVCQLAHKPTFEHGPILSAQWKPWFAKYWHFSVGFGYVTIYQHSAISGGVNRTKRVRAHERVHTRQSIDMTVIACLVGLISGLWTWNFWLFVGIWCSGIFWLLVCYLTSLLRYGADGWRQIYKQAEHERAAYAECELDSKGNTWLEYYENDD